MDNPCAICVQFCYQSNGIFTNVTSKTTEKHQTNTHQNEAKSSKKLEKAKKNTQEPKFLSVFVLVREMGLEPMGKRAKSLRAATTFRFSRTIRVQF